MVDTMLDEPTVRVTKGKVRRLRKARAPRGTPMVLVRLDDTADGETAYASFASPDGITWKAYAYFTNAPTQSYGVLLGEDGRFAEDQDGNLLPAIPIED